jgi:hypothetical protein
LKYKDFSAKPEIGGKGLKVGLRLAHERRAEFWEAAVWADAIWAAIAFS